MLNNRWLFVVALVTVCYNITDATFQGDLRGLNIYNAPGSFKRWPSFMNVNNPFSCNNEGLYHHPDDCTKFYRCTNILGRNDYTHISFTCQDGTVFSSEFSACITGTCSQDLLSAAAIEKKKFNDDLMINYGTPSRSSVGSSLPKCLSEGRYPDEHDCGKFYDCVLNNEGELISTEHSCYGNAYDAMLQACVPSHMVEECYPDSNRSRRQLAVKDPYLEGLCSNNSNNFTCADCNTLIMCLEEVSYPIPCEGGSACITDIDEFNGGVCHPRVPKECTCNQEDLLKKDLYDTSKYLVCDTDSATPVVRKCPEGSIFNETRQDCIAPTDPTCSTSGPGTFAAVNDCSRYYTCRFTSKGFIQNWFTCPNEKMFNEKSQECEDPCEWQYGNFTCKEKGRFSNPINCSGYYECIENPSNSTKFIQVEHICPAGYEWTQEVSEGHCLVIGTTRERCVARATKPSTCSYPTELCRSKALAVCVNEFSYCECEENPETYPSKCSPCPEGHISNTTGCYPLCSNLTCSDNEMCLDGNGLEPGVCTCVSGFVHDEGQCKGTCSNTTCGVDTCTENDITYTFCECKDNNGTTAGKCSPCPDGHISNTTGCYPDCSILTCSDNEFCFDGNGTVPGVCTCVSGHAWEGNQCRGTCNHTTCGVQSCFDNGVEHNFCECKDNNGTTAGKCFPCAESHISNTTGCYPGCSNLNCTVANEACFDGNGTLPGVCEYERKGGQCKDTSNGFEIFNGRFIRRTRSTDPRGDYYTCMNFCTQFGAHPFIPSSKADYDMLENSKDTLLTYYQYLPARVHEGTLRWFTGQVVSDNNYLWQWSEKSNVFSKGNLTEGQCLFYGGTCSGTGTCSSSNVHLTGYKKYVSYPPTCERL